MTKLEKHLQKHPHDYQSQIALLRKRSEDFEYQIRQVKIQRIKEIKRQEKEYDNNIN